MYWLKLGQVVINNRSTIAESISLVNYLNKSKLKIKKSRHLTEVERNLLADLVDMYKETVENKCTDAATSKVNVVLYSSYYNCSLILLFHNLCILVSKA